MEETILNGDATVCKCDVKGVSEEETTGKAAYVGGPIDPACNQTLTFVIDTTAPQTLFVSLPEMLGTGAYFLDELDGSFTVSVDDSIPGQPTTCRAHIVSGTGWIDSIDLPDGTPTGTNFFTFGPSVSSSGVVDLDTGLFEMQAVGSIINDIFPQGVPTLNTFTGDVDFGNGTLTWDSATCDYFFVCDLDEDGDIDISDIQPIFQARNLLVQPGDPRDFDGDGIVTVNDARSCMLACTKPACGQL